MTVKELKEILDACNEDARVYICDESGQIPLRDEHVYHNVNANTVTFDEWCIQEVPSIASWKDETR